MPCGQTVYLFCAFIPCLINKDRCSFQLCRSLEEAYDDFNLALSQVQFWFGYSVICTSIVWRGSPQHQSLLVLWHLHFQKFSLEWTWNSRLVQNHQGARNRKPCWIYECLTSLPRKNWQISLEISSHPAKPVSMQHFTILSLELLIFSFLTKKISIFWLLSLQISVPLILISYSAPSVPQIKP